MNLVAIHFARLGPYHVARLRSAVEVFGKMGWRVVALETAGGDATYAWEKTESVSGDFERRTIFPDRVYEEIPSAELRRGMHRALEELKPDAVAVAGWGTVDARACLDWCRRVGVKSIVMSETREADGRRVWWREWIKSRIVRRFDGALCGGESHKRYLAGLGMPEERIAFGYNVVDNEFFGGCGELGAGREAPEARRSEVGDKKGDESLTTNHTNLHERGEVFLTTDNTDEHGCGDAGQSLADQAGAVFSNPSASDLGRDFENSSLIRYADNPASSPATSHSLLATAPKAHPQPYFLASNRFVERKNLSRLIRAYARYMENFEGGDFSVHESVGGVWPLVLLGDGELRGELEGLCGALGIELFSAQESGDLKLNSYKLNTPAAGGLVVFAGFRQIEELPTFYSGAGAFLHPALEEPWGLVINEAMASGLPVLSSRNVGAAEELVVEGETGWLFDPESIEEMAAAMVKVAGIPEADRMAMGRAALEMVERKVPLKAFGEGLAKLIGKSEIGNWR